MLLLAGPFADWTGALLVLEGDPEPIERRLAGDPFVMHGVFSPPVVRPWLIWVDRGVGGSV